jgi:hypothetical protein
MWPLRALAAAIAAPLYVRTGRWRQLLNSNFETHSPDRPRGIYLTVKLLRGFSRAHLPGFRATCLYRSVAVCLLLRWSGYNAVLRLGAAADPLPKAHAWVEDGQGRLLYEQALGFVPLEQHA